MPRSRAGVAESFINGWRAARLATDAIEVTVLPGKGADIFALVDLATGIDPLFKAPWGLAPPGTAPRAGSGGDAFLANYEGGWQELFPNTNDGCTSAGVTVPFHGEAATRAWSVSVEAGDGQDVTVRFSVDCLLSLRLEWVMRLRRAEVSNPALQMAFRLDWDPGVFKGSSPGSRSAVRRPCRCAAAATQSSAPVARSGRPAGRRWLDSRAPDRPAARRRARWRARGRLPRPSAAR